MRVAASGTTSVMYLAELRPAILVIAVRGLVEVVVEALQLELLTGYLVTRTSSSRNCPGCSGTLGRRSGICRRLQRCIRSPLSSGQR